MSEMSRAGHSYGRHFQPRHQRNILQRVIALGQQPELGEQRRFGGNSCAATPERLTAPRTASLSEGVGIPSVRGPDRKLCCVVTRA